MAEYGFGIGVTIKADTSGADDVKKGLNDISKTAKKTSEDTKKAMEAINFAKSTSELQMIESKMLSVGSKLDKMFNGDKWDFGKFGDYVKQIKRLGEQYDKIMKPGDNPLVNTMTPDMASEIADQTTKIDLLERKVNDAREAYAKLYNSGVTGKRLTSALEEIQKAQANYNAELEKMYSHQNREVMRLITPEEAASFARNINTMTKLRTDLEYAKSKLANFLNARMLGDDSAQNDKHIADWSAKINKIEAEIQKLNESGGANRMTESIHAMGEEATATQTKIEGLIESAEGLRVHSAPASGSVVNDSAWDEMSHAFADNTLSRYLDEILAKGSQVADVFKNIGRSVGGAVSARLKQFASNLSSVAGAFKRIMFYRAVRTIIKEIGQGFKEGVNNLYQWSKQLNGDFSQAMDKLATSGLYMKNSLGAMVAPLINALAPAIDFVIDRFVDLLNVINQVFALLSGAASWTKAIKYPKEYAKAVGGAASNSKKLGLAGIDMLTILDKHKGSSGSGFSAEDYAGMFQEMTDFNSRLQDLVGKMKLNFNDVLFDWDDLSGEDIAKKAIVGLSTALGAATGFMIGGVPGAVIGTLLGCTLGLAIDSVIFNDDDKLSRNEIGEMLRLALIGITGGVIGFTLGGPAGALLGATIGIALFGGIKTFDFLKGGTTGDDMLKKLEPVLNTIGGALIGFKLGGGLGAVIGATIGLGLSLGIETFGFEDTSNWTAKDWLQHILDAITPHVQGGISLALGDKVGYEALIGLGLSFQLATQPEMDGEAAAGGFFKGIKNKIDTGKQWLKDNVTDPFTKWFKELFGIDGQSSTVTASIGKSLTQGFWDGFKERWTKFTNDMRTKWNSLKTWWSTLELPSFRVKTPHLSWSTQPAGGWMASVLSALGLPTSLPKLNVSWYAQGGFPDAGELFVANERGAEMVGSMDGHTAVANNDQIVDGIRQGVYDAVTSAMASGGFSANVYLDGKQISGSVVKNVNNEIRRTGRSPILSY